MRVEMILDGPSISMNLLLPESWLTAEKPSGRTIWLLHDKFDLASDWVSFTQAELFTEKTGTAIVCAYMNSARYTDWKEGCTWEKFFVEDLWEYVHEVFPVLSKKPNDNYLFGYGRGGFGAIKFALLYPEQYGAAYSVSYDDRPVQQAMNGTAKVFANGNTGYGTPEEVAVSNDNLPYLIPRLAKSGRTKPIIYMTGKTCDRNHCRSRDIYTVLAKHNYPVTWQEEDGVTAVPTHSFIDDVEMWLFVNEQLDIATRILQKTSETNA